MLKPLSIGAPPLGREQAGVPRLRDRRQKAKPLRAAATGSQLTVTMSQIRQTPHGTGFLGRDYPRAEGAATDLRASGFEIGGAAQRVGLELLDQRAFRLGHLLG